MAANSRRDGSVSDLTAWILSPWLFPLTSCWICDIVKVKSTTDDEKTQSLVLAGATGNNDQEFSVGWEGGNG